MNTNFWIFCLIIYFAKNHGVFGIQELKTCTSGSAVLKIPMSIQNQIPSFLWTKDGDHLAYEPRYQFNANTLTIVDAIPNDGGIYCAQLQINDRNYKFYYKLIVADSRLTLLTPPKVIAAEGSNVTIKVEARRHGISAWTFNGDYLDVNANINHFKFLDPRDFDIINGGVLCIKNIQKRHSGVYLMTFDVEGCETTIKTQVEVFSTKLESIDYKSEELIYERILSEKYKPMFKTSAGMIVIIIAVIAVSAGVSGLITLWCLGLCKLLKKHWLKNKVTPFSKELSKENLLTDVQQNELLSTNKKKSFKKSAFKALTKFGNNFHSNKKKLNTRNPDGYKILVEEVDSGEDQNIDVDGGTNSFHSFNNTLDSSHTNKKYEHNNNNNDIDLDKDRENIAYNKKKKLVKISPPNSLIETEKKNKNIFNTIR